MTHKLRFTLVVFIAGFALTYSCKLLKNNSLSLTINTISNDTLNDIKVIFYKYKSKTDSPFHFMGKEAANFNNLKSTSFNTFDFKRLKKGKYTTILYFNLNGSRRIYRIDSLEIKPGKNIVNQIVTLK